MFANEEVDRVLGARFDAAKKTRWSKRSIRDLAEKVGHGFDDHSKRETKRMIKGSTGVDVELEIPDLSKRLRSWASGNADLITGASDRFKKKLIRAVADGVESGESVDDIRDRIKAQYYGPRGPEFLKSERHLDFIVRDQVAKLQMDLQGERFKQLGVERYVWRTQRDDRVRPSHEEREDQTFVMGDAIQPQLKKLGLTIDKIDGHPSEPPGCRCWMEPDLVEMIERTKEEKPKPKKPKPKRKPRRVEPKPDPIEKLQREAEERLRLVEEERRRIQEEEDRRRRARFGRQDYDQANHARALNAYGQLLHGTAPRREFNASELDSAIKNISNPNDQRRATREVNELIAEYGLVNRDAYDRRSRAGDIVTGAAMPNGAAAYHGWDGEIALGAERTKELTNFANGDRSFRSLNAAKDLVHEALHGTSPMQPTSYVDHGAVVEEVTTESVARKIVRERFDANPLSSFSPEYPFLAYSDPIRKVLHIIDPSSKPDLKIAGELLEQASLIYKGGTSTSVASADDATSRFTEAILVATNKTTDQRERVRISSELRKLRL